MLIKNNTIHFLIPSPVVSIPRHSDRNRATLCLQVLLYPYASQLSIDTWRPLARCFNHKFHIYHYILHREQAFGLIYSTDTTKQSKSQNGANLNLILPVEYDGSLSYKMSPLFMSLSEYRKMPLIHYGLISSFTNIVNCFIYICKTPCVLPNSIYMYVKKNKMQSWKEVSKRNNIFSLVTLHSNA